MSARMLSILFSLLCIVATALAFGRDRRLPVTTAFRE